MSFSLFRKKPDAQSLDAELQRNLEEIKTLDSLIESRRSLLKALEEALGNQVWPDIYDALAAEPPPYDVVAYRDWKVLLRHYIKRFARHRATRLYLFHGGCHGCQRQMRQCIGCCLECMYSPASPTWGSRDVEKYDYNTRRKPENVPFPYHLIEEGEA